MNEQVNAANFAQDVTQKTPTRSEIQFPTRTKPRRDSRADERRAVRHERIGQINTIKRPSPIDMQGLQHIGRRRAISNAGFDHNLWLEQTTHRVAKSRQHKPCIYRRGEWPVGSHQVAMNLMFNLLKSRFCQKLL